MTTRVLISFYCDDRPGVVEAISEAVSANSGNWLDSQLSRLGGRFAGVIHVHIAKVNVDGLKASLDALSENGITSTVTEAGDHSGGAVAVRELTLMGPDRTGIVHELTRALNTAGFNVQSLETTVETAPMSGEPLFRANARIELLEGARLDELEWQLDALAEAMTLEIDLLP